MRLNKKVIGTLLGIAGILAVTAVTTNEIQVSEKELGVSEAANTSLEDEAVAGVTAALNAYQKNAAEQAVTKVSVEKEDIEVVAASLEGDSQDAGVMNEEDAKTSDTEASDEKAADNNSTESESKEAQPELTKEEEKWQDYLMADVEQSLNVRKKANEDAEIVGKLYKGDRAKILKAGD
ncbi:MAG: SH3 domain-containing protein, partial [Lachnospiraceae bacterium]|nr:SH3 domain-containing protein [Lachnospiraceae bacterium]